MTGFRTVLLKGSRKFTMKFYQVSVSKPNPLGTLSSNGWGPPDVDTALLYQTKMLVRKK